MSKGSRKSYTERCTFCGKSRHMVDSLVAGPPDVYICNECVDLCNTILIEENRKTTGGDESKLVARRGSAGPQAA